MNNLILFLIEISLSIGLSIIVVITINHALLNILCELCPSDKHAKFWQVYIKAIIYILPLIIVLMTDIQTELTGLNHIKVSLTTILFGLFASLIIIGIKLYPSDLKKTAVPTLKQISEE